MNSNNGSFWPSYVDVMTTLFAITLVLFVVSYVNFQKQMADNKNLREKYEIVVKEYDDIISVYATVGKIDKTKYFKYDDQYLKHLFQVNVEYQRGEFEITKLKQDNYNFFEADEIRDSIEAAGNLIVRTIESLKKSANDNVKFLVVIEGQASKVPFYIDSWKNNYTLSYLRAQKLNEFWKTKGIDFSRLGRCELVISGSGEGGVPRVQSGPMPANIYSPEYKAWSDLEASNQRFLIHIVPVIGNIEDAEKKLQEIEKLRNIIENGSK